jgi:hypothetical protein
MFLSRVRGIYVFWSISHLSIRLNRATRPLEFFRVVADLNIRPLMAGQIVSTTGVAASDSWFQAQQQEHNTLKFVAN